MNDYTEELEIREVRTGRTLMCRNVTFPCTSKPAKKSANILFIHGSCASSIQWNRLIDELKSIRLLSNNETDSSPKSALFINGMIECILFDQLGCGGSKHPADDWPAYSASELLLDLETIARSVLRNDDNTPLFIVAHSYGVSQTIQLINNLNPSEASRVKGVVLIGGALKGGPALVAIDGGHWIFRYLPMFFLRGIQPFLSKLFVRSAFIDKELQKEALEISNKNDMAMCKAFYRQQKYATAEDASKLKNIPALVIHGREDKVFPIDAGDHLNQSLPKSELCVIPDASHQVFEEKYAEVAEAISVFLYNQMST